MVRKMVKKKIKLSDLESEIVQLSYPNISEVFDSLFFQCPRCIGTKDSHWVQIPYSKTKTHERNVGPIWTHKSGSTIDDLTLSPSVRSVCGGCHVHGFVRDGDWLDC